MVGKIDDNDVVVNKEKCLRSIWYFDIFEINMKLNNTDNLVNISKT